MRFFFPEPFKESLMWKTFAYKLRPVWTLTWVEATQPTLRSRRPEPSETDIYFNKQCALDFIKKKGRQHIKQWVDDMNVYLKSEECKYDMHIYKCKANRYTHRIHCSHFELGHYFLSLVCHEMYRQ